MKNLIALLLSCAFIAVSGCSDKSASMPKISGSGIASLESGEIIFKNDPYPAYLIDVKGVAGAEAFGRWTSGSEASFKFNHSLPKNFILKIKAGAWGENIDKPIKVRIGSVEKEAIFKGDPFNGPTEVNLEIALTESSDTITLMIPFPGSDKNDERKIGVGLISMKIESKGS